MFIDLTKNIYDKMFTHQFLMSVMGSFDQELLRSFVKITEKKLESLDADESIKKRIFHFVVECAQNLCNADVGERDCRNNLFLIGKNGENYIIHLGTVYTKAESKHISEVIDSVNRLDTAEIRDKFYKELASKEFARQNHFLLSLLDLSKRTRDKVNYQVFSIDEQNDFFSFNTSITSVTD